MDRVEYGRRREAIGRQGVARRSTLERELDAMRDEDKRLAERVEEAASLTGQELFGVSERVASGLLPASLMAKVDAAAAQLRWFQGAAEDEGRSRDIRRREARRRIACRRSSTTVAYGSPDWMTSSPGDAARGCGDPPRSHDALAWLGRRHAVVGGLAVCHVRVVRPHQAHPTRVIAL